MLNVASSDKNVHGPLELSQKQALLIAYHEFQRGAPRTLSNTSGC